jgi:ABC-type protease/lipase transport system fused ATPase/permease subunit
LTAVPVEEEWVALPPPTRSLRLTAVTIVPPGSGGAALYDAGFALAAL